MAYRLGLQPARAVPLPPETCMDDLLLVQDFFQFAVELASNRAWSQAFYNNCLPWKLSQLFLPDEQLGLLSEELHEMAAKLIELETATKEFPGDGKLNLLLEDVGTLSWPFVREIIQTGEHCRWDVRDKDLRELAYQMARGPGETKSSLENTFGYLQEPAWGQSPP